MGLTLGEAARHCGLSKASLSKAIANGRLSAVRRGDGAWAIDTAELQRFLDANGHAVNPKPLAGEQHADEVFGLRVRAEVAEKMLILLQAQLTEMTGQRDRWHEAFQATQRLLPAPAPRRSWWPWRQAG
jgi:excisionase family DNA binding protein